MHFCLKSLTPENPSKGASEGKDEFAKKHYSCRGLVQVLVVFIQYLVILLFI